MIEDARVFVADAPQMVSASPDGAWVAIVDVGGVAIVDPVSAAVHAEVPIAEDAACEVAWAGAPSRLVVVNRFAAHAVVQLVDVGTAGVPRPLGEVRLDHPAHVLATGTLHALLVGERGTTVVTAIGDKPTTAEFPTRALPTAAGAFGPHHVVVAAAGALEEWDTHARQPRRRFRLPKPIHVRYVGGTERLLWTVSQADPARVDIFPLVNRGQPKFHELEEPIAAIAGHPRVELLVWIGATSGQARVLDLEGRGRGRAIGAPGQQLCALAAGRQVGAVLVAAGELLAIEVLESRGPDARRGAPADEATGHGNGSVGGGGGVGGHVMGGSGVDGSGAGGHVMGGSGMGASGVGGSGVASSVGSTGSSGSFPASGTSDPELVLPVAPLGDLDTPASAASARVDRAAAAADRIADLGAGPTPASATELSNRLVGWRTIAGEPTTGVPPVAAPAVAPRVVRAAAPAAASPAIRTWRETLIDWTRTALTSAPPAPPRGSPLDALVQRVALAEPLDAGVALLYGAHLLGHDGVAPAELVRAVKVWDEALGNGALAASGVARWQRSRIRLAPVVRDALDERPPRTGDLVGAPGAASSLITPCAVRVSSGRAADAARGLVAMAGGAYLVVARASDPADAFLEARVRGAIALVETDVPLRDGAVRVLGPGDMVDDLAVIDLD
jgi:hypothetical protein